MPDDQAPSPPTRIGATPIGDSIAAEPAREGELKAAALLAAIEAAGLPIVGSVADVEITVVEAELYHTVGVRMTVAATRNGDMVPGWDIDRVHICPPADFFSGGTVTEDPLAVCLHDLLEYAAAA